MDTSTKCPSCGRVGEPQHDVDRVTVYVCGHPEDCDYEATWEAARDEFDRKNINIAKKEA